MMDQGWRSSLASTRKRGLDEGKAQQQLNPPVATADENLTGQVFSGVVEGSFEAGYFLTVKVIDTEKQLIGIVFLPDKVAPLTPATDLFPQAKMYLREDPSSNQQTQPEAKKNAADDFGSEPQTDKNQSDNHPMSLGSGSIDERDHPMDTEIKDVGGSSADEKLTEPQGQTLSLMPQFASDDIPIDDHTVMSSEASKTAVTATSSSPQDSFAEGSTTFVDFFPATATNHKQATGSSSSLSLELFQNETKQPGAEDEKSPADAEPHGVVVKSASPIDDDVPEELQLELGSKKMNAASVATEANPDQPASSKSGFLVDLFESREETVKDPEETNAGSESGFPEVATKGDDNDS